MCAPHLPEMLGGVAVKRCIKKRAKGLASFEAHLSHDGKSGVVYGFKPSRLGKEVQYIGTFRNERSAQRCAAVLNRQAPKTTMPELKLYKVPYGDITLRVLATSQAEANQRIMYKGD